MLTGPHIKERLSLAYLHAISGHAGINLSHGDIHDYGIDAQLSSVARVRGKLQDSGFPVAIQLKATVSWIAEDESIAYDLEADAYNKMVTRPTAAVPYYIFLLCLPRDETLWLNASEDQLVLKNCCYWLRETGEPTSSSSSKRVRFLRKNLVTVKSIRAIMAAARGELIP